MKTTLYWDDGYCLYYKNKNNIWRKRRRCIGWLTCHVQDFKPSDFNHSLTVNNFKEK